GLGRFGQSSDPGTGWTIAQVLVNAFNNDPNSVVTATFGGNPDGQVQFVTKGTGSGVNYATSAVIHSNANCCGQVTYTQDMQWVWIPPGGTAYVIQFDSPFPGNLTGGH